MEGVKK